MDVSSDSWTLLWQSIVLGVVEGVTEFLPVSSTGHLILAGRLIGFEGDVAGTFEVVIQLGAILAVVWLFRERFLGLASMGRGEGFHGRRGVGMLVLTTVPALILGPLFHPVIKTYLFEAKMVAVGLTIGSLWIFAVEYGYRQDRPKPLDGITWKMALGIGVFQCLAMWPGMSRSASTILGGMLLGLNRRAATEYSFFAAVPMMVAATVYDLYKSWGTFDAQGWWVLGVGFVMAFLSALVAVKAFVQFISRHTFVPFAWYRLGVAAVVFYVLW
ncbi:MAG TPA: undecaprenyl-diphosphate phosphatase [Kiritimatiellia bacterium]|nr:undecaprenyl-diphosphate phosphatase [Kiritimatiellia bacterium]